jgi:ABC-type polysaccharide transport system permease subunit
MALPLILLVFMFCYMPLFGWVYAFFNYKPGIPLFQCEFVGLKFFKLIFSDAVDMLRVMKNTVIFALLGYVCAPLPMILAMLLNEVRFKPYKKVVQTLTTLPNFISWIIIYSLSFNIFSNDGLLNDVLFDLGLITKSTNLLGDKDSVYLFQTLLTLWKTVGWNSIIYLAAISGIDQELYDAAMIDGAGHFRSALHITLPGLMPTFVVLLLLSIGNFVGVDSSSIIILRIP